MSSIVFFQETFDYLKKCFLNSFQLIFQLKFLIQKKHWYLGINFKFFKEGKNLFCLKMENILIEKHKFILSFLNEKEI